MDRIIQPYSAPGSAVGVASATAPAPMLAPPKSPSDFVRAARRGLPVVIVLTALSGVIGSAYVMRLPPVYRATGHVQIEPPRFDANLAVILSGNVIPTNDRETSEKFVPNRLAWLQGRSLAAEVIGPGELGVGQGYEGNPEGEILANISHRRFQPGTNIFEIALEGSDPERVSKLLTALLERFKARIRKESDATLTNATGQSVISIKAIQKQIDDLTGVIGTAIAATPIFAPGGKNLLLEDYTTLKAHLLTKKARYEDLRHEERIAAMFPGLRDLAPPSKYEARITYLEERGEYYRDQLEQAARLVRREKLNTDPATRRWAKLLNKVYDDLDAYRKLDVEAPEKPDRTAISLAHAAEEIRQIDREVKSQFAEIQTTMPVFDQYQSLVADREGKRQQLAGIREKLSQFEMVSATKPETVTILQVPTEPGSPARPNRPMLIVLCTMAGLVVGLGLVTGREYLDRSVKVPEHLTLGLGLPILSVIPRMRRIAKLQRGGHLWTANDPLSPEADSYRILRAGLIGAAGPKSSIVTLLVTSAKPGEGKSTTALNLALTCARAGERTLLIDADLRRPTLAEVFDAAEPNVGLVEALKGEMPWQRAVVRTDVANLDFLPTGDPSGVPIEILGTLELRQLIAAVSGQFQRVIIDAPSVLGMADCRMLGRTVDAAILVVRSGAHAMLPLRRAKEMLAQSRVPIAGVVFNGLTDDLDNWSSHAASLPTVARPSRSALNAPPVEAEYAATS